MKEIFLVMSFCQIIFKRKVSSKKWAYRLEAHEIFNKKMISSKIQIYLKKQINKFSPALNKFWFHWKSFSYWEFHELLNGISTFLKALSVQKFFRKMTSLQKFLSKNDQIMWYRLPCVKEKILCHIIIFLRVIKWFFKKIDIKYS